MMIRLDTGFADEQPATSDKPLLTINPNVEILVCLIARKCNVHALDDSPSLRC
jgi:hypothetical protein